MLFIFFLQMVSISFSIVLDVCLILIYLFLRHCNVADYTHCKWLAKMPNWASWRPPLRG